MDQITVNVSTGVILAALSGLSFLAYKHPKAYDKVGAVVLTITILALIVIGAAYAGGQIALLALVPHLKEGGFDDANKAIDAAFPAASWQVFVGGGALIVYLFFLSGLPKLLANEASDKKVEDKDKAEGQEKVS